MIPTQNAAGQSPLETVIGNVVLPQAVRAISQYRHAVGYREAAVSRQAKRAFANLECKRHFTHVAGGDPFQPRGIGRIQRKIEGRKFPRPAQEPRHRRRRPGVPKGHAENPAPWRLARKRGQSPEKPLKVRQVCTNGRVQSRISSLEWAGPVKKSSSSCLSSKRCNGFRPSSRQILRMWNS